MYVIYTYDMYKIDMKSWNQFKKELLKDKGVRTEYERLEPQYQVVSQLIDARIKKGITQRELAKKMGTKQPAIARLESGNTNPTIGFLEKASKALDTKITVSIG